MRLVESPMKLEELRMKQEMLLKTPEAIQTKLGLTVQQKRQEELQMRLERRLGY
jgi:hypothetical protein